MERFTAKKARALTENTERLLSRLYKWIKDTAIRNSNIFNLHLEDFDYNVLDRCLTILKEDGFKVIIDSDTDEVFISW